MKVVPFDLFIEFIDHSQRLASSRLDRLMKTSKEVFHAVLDGLRSDLCELMSYR